MNRIAIGLFYGVSLLASTSFAQEKSTHTVLLDQFEQTEFLTAAKMNQFPEAIRKDLFERFGGKWSSPFPQIAHSGGPINQISDAGGPFNPTDQLDGRPQRRFVFGGNSPGLYFVVYEHGGIGYHHHLDIYRGKKPVLVFHGTFSAPHRKTPTIETVKRAFKDGQIHEQPIKFDP
jgi:hypothetical protein